jgi:uroporphyrin-III C-methyltransferase
MMNHVKTPTIQIVGAGPGDPELITLKGMKAIEKADVILYDALSSPELLSYAKSGCKMIYVGKRKNKHAFTQNEINQLLVFYACQYEKVVRLKGGDPYVFGRGHEELEYAMKRGVEVQVIPGISSALSAPAAAGIPLTKRGVNESFWVVTGTLSNGEISPDIFHAAQSTATVIILMGLSQLSKLIPIFNKARDCKEPVAIIQQATLPGQKAVRGTLSTIQKIVHEQQIESPAVIVIGKVVEESLLAEQVQCIFTEPILKMAV